MTVLDPDSLSQRAEALEGAPPEEVLTWAATTFRPRIALTTSFGGGAGLVLAHMLASVAPDVPVILINTGFLFPETLALKETYARRFGLRIVEVHPRLSPQEQERQFGPALWSRDPDLCCHLRKVEPMERVLAGLDAWITGLRREQSHTRAHVRVLEWHESQGRPLLKVNPLAHWTRAQVEAYLHQHDLPQNPLLIRGYRSIGCTHCTRPVAEGEAERAGRWWGHEKTECGLHTFTRRLAALGSATAGPPLNGPLAEPSR